MQELLVCVLECIRPGIDGCLDAFVFVCFEDFETKGSVFVRLEQVFEFG